MTTPSTLPREHSDASAALVEAWVGHAALMVEGWLTAEWTWGGRPLGEWTASVDVVFDQARCRLWDSGPAPDRRPIPQEVPEPWARAIGDWTHPAWPDLVEAWALEGRWLHPETSFAIDQVLFSRDQSGLFIGCVDRDDPSAPRRFRPESDPQTTDLGVIVFPLRPYQALPYLAAGWSPHDAMLITAGSTVLEACVHEALETFQTAPGVPVWDPHRPGPSVEVEIVWRTRPPVGSLALPCTP